MTYPRNADAQASFVQAYRSRAVAAGGNDKPVMQSLYVDLTDDADAPAQPIHLGIRSGMNYLNHYLKSLEEIGVNHVALNLRFNQADIETTMKRKAVNLLPGFANRGYAQ